MKQRSGGGSHYGRDPVPVPVKQESSGRGALSMKYPDSYEPRALGALKREVAQAKRATRKSAPDIVARFDPQSVDSPFTVGPERPLTRRMSAPGSVLEQFTTLGNSSRVSDPKLKAMAMANITSQAADAEDEDDDHDEWGTFVEAPRWEDWQDYAMHGAFTSPAALDTEEEALNRLQILSPYLPHMLVHTALHDLNIPLGETPSVQRVLGAVMIADITGFTALTERALTSKRGNELVEELTGCMNNYFDEAVELVLEYGGDTIKYAGDSIIVCFPVDHASNETQTACTLRAAACGFDLISCLGAYTPELGGYGNSAFEDETYDNDGGPRDSFLPRPSTVSRSLTARGIREKKGTEAVKILVVDDIMLNRVVLSKMLSKLNCEVVLASNGREAVKAHSKHNFDAIFMDVHMPVLDGIGASHLIRRSGHARSKTPIIGVCNRVDDQLMKECLAAGMDDLLSKPVTMSQLVTVLRTLRASRTVRTRTPEPDRTSTVTPSKTTTSLSPLARASASPRPAHYYDHDRSERKYSAAALQGQQLPATATAPVPATATATATGHGFENATCSNSPAIGRGISPTPAPRDQRRHAPPEEIATTGPSRKSRHKSNKKNSVVRAALQDQRSSNVSASLTLALKVLIGTGEVCMLSVGGGLQMPSGLPRWEYFMADMPTRPESDPDGRQFRHPMEQLRGCEEHANSGNVILSPEAWSLVGKQCEGEHIEGGFFRLSHVVGRVSMPPTLHPDRNSEDRKRIPMGVHILKRYLPELLRSKIEASAGTDSRVRAEVRHVTCLYLGFPSLSSVEASEVVLLDNVQKAMLTVQQSLRLFDGLLVQFRMDEKGYVMICAFGLPGNLHEDDPKRGVQTALDVLGKFKAFDQKVDIGVTTGKLLCTVVGGKRRCEYTVFGNCINLSARLMKKANNEILVDNDTYKMTSDVLEAVVLPPMRVKGRTGLLKVYRVISYKVVTARSVRSKSLASPIASPKEFEDILCSTIFGRSPELEAAITRIDAFLLKESKRAHAKAKHQSISEASQDELQLAMDGDRDSEGVSNDGSSFSDNYSGENRTDIGAASQVSSSGQTSKGSTPPDVPITTAIIVTGHAGIGKSKLLESLSCHLKDSPAQILFTGSEQASSASNILVFGPWVKLLLDLLSFDADFSQEERGSVVINLLDKESRQYAHLLKDILKIKIKGQLRSKTSPRQEKQAKTFRRSISEGSYISRDESIHPRAQPAPRVSFIANLAAQGASLLTKKSLKTTRQLDVKSESSPSSSGTGDLGRQTSADSNSNEGREPPDPELGGVHFELTSTFMQRTDRQEASPLRRNNSSQQLNRDTQSLSLLTSLAASDVDTLSGQVHPEVDRYLRDYPSTTQEIAPVYKAQEESLAGEPELKYQPLKLDAEFDVSDIDAQITSGNTLSESEHLEASTSTPMTRLEHEMLETEFDPTNFPSTLEIDRSVREHTDALIEVSEAEAQSLDPHQDLSQYPNTGTSEIKMSKNQLSDPLTRSFELKLQPLQTEAAHTSFEFPSTLETAPSETPHREVSIKAPTIGFQRLMLEAEPEIPTGRSTTNPLNSENPQPPQILDFSKSPTQSSPTLQTEPDLIDFSSTVLETRLSLPEASARGPEFGFQQVGPGVSNSLLDYSFPSISETAIAENSDSEALSRAPDLTFKTMEPSNHDLDDHELSGKAESLTEAAKGRPAAGFRTFSEVWKKRHSMDHGVLLRRASQEFGWVDGISSTTPPKPPKDQGRRISIESQSTKEERMNASPEISMQRVGKLIQELLLTLVKRPCVIFVEDAHLMDNPSWSILKAVTQEKDTGILVLAACRPWGAHAPKEYTTMVQASSTLLINLRELDEKSTWAFVRQTICQALGGYTEIPQQIFQVISNRTQGHPLFSEQMAIALVEMKIISPGNPEETLKRLGTFELEKFNFSYSVEALITSRVDLLEPNQALTLKVASVIGLNFSVIILLSVLNQQLQRERAPCFTNEQLETALRGLDKLNFINRTSKSDRSVYSFSNSVTRDATYDMLPVKQRRMIHADIAKELVKLGTSGVRCVTIAHHYTMACKDVEELEAGLAAIAIDHWEEAASSALFKFGEYELAIEYYLNAISLGTAVLDHINRLRLASWHHYLSRAYAAVGDVDNGTKHTILALKYAGEDVSEDLDLTRRSQQERTSACCSAVFEPGIWAWKIYCHRGLLGWLLSVTRQGDTSESRESILKCEALAQLATLAICKEELHSAKNVSRRYLAVAHEASSTGSHPLEVARACSVAALVTKSAFLRKYRCLKCTESLRVQEKSKYQSVQAADIHYNLAVVCLFQGRWNKAQKHASKALLIYGASQGRREVDLCRCLIAVGQLYQGQYENCHQEGVRLLGYRHEHPQLRVWAIFLVVASLNSMKRYQDSAKAVALLDDAPCSITSLALQVKALGWETSLCLDRQADLQDALTLLPQLMSLTPLTAIYPKALAAAAEVLLIALQDNQISSPQRAAREEAMTLLLKCMKTAANRIGIIYFYYKFFKARHAWARGQYNLAAVLFKQAMKFSLRVKMLPAATAANAWLAKCNAPGLLSEPPV